jgi:uncharacterized phage-associated protein
MYNPVFLSNNFLQRSFEDETLVTPMKLQKMMYFLYRDYLKQTNEPLFAERFMTWKYGPVLESVYQEYKGYGGRSIDRYGGKNGEIYKVDESGDKPLSNLLSVLWEKCRYIDAIRLSEITHGEGAAWREAYNSRKSFLRDEDILKDETLITYA